MLGLKIKADYPNSRELKLHLANGSLTKLLLTVRNRGKLPVREGDGVATFDMGKIIGQPTTTPITNKQTKCEDTHQKQCLLSNWSDFLITLLLLDMWIG